MIQSVGVQMDADVSCEALAAFVEAWYDEYAAPPYTGNRKGLFVWRF